MTAVTAYLLEVEEGGGEEGEEGGVGEGEQLGGGGVLLWPRPQHLVQGQYCAIKTSGCVYKKIRFFGQKTVENLTSNAILLIPFNKYFPLDFHHNIHLYTYTVLYRGVYRTGFAHNIHPAWRRSLRRQSRAGERTVPHLETEP